MFSQLCLNDGLKIDVHDCDISWVGDLDSEP